MKISSFKGTNDYLPQEVILREYLQNKIMQIYQANGFQRISTPVFEDLENLDKSDGGDNLSLIFKIMKRGEKLKAAIAAARFDDLADMGLRYDLTLPLCRYYANNRQSLISPLKCIQIDKVYRAERPQKGRLRELMQCDIDIIGSNSVYCEIELINVTAQALLAIGLNNFVVKINDRNILEDALKSIGFQQNDIGTVCIAIDKLGKIGIEGVAAELSSKGFPMESISKLSALLNNLPPTTDQINAGSSMASRICDLQKIISEVKNLAEGKYAIKFDLSLVRGQGYYTGTVFEIESNNFNGSIAGGGRYDNLIAKFTQEQIPAVGFSIGFERIYCILSEEKYEVPDKRERVAILFDNNFIQANKQAELIRNKYDVTLYEKPKKVGKLLMNLQVNGYYGFYDLSQSAEIKLFG